MAFFEDIGKKVSQTSQDAIKKTKALAETTKINGLISAEKRVIAENYGKIGEKYYELFSDSPEESLAVFIAAIKEANQQIEEYEDQIKKLKGIDSCPNCGAPAKEGALFCTSCGTKLETPPAEEKVELTIRVCGNCGSQVAEGALFCSECGTKTE